MSFRTQLLQEPAVNELTGAEQIFVQRATAGVLELAETTAPSTTAGVGKLYVKSGDSKLYYKNDSGVEIEIGAAAVWGGITGTLSNQTDLQVALDAKATPADITTAIDALIAAAPGALDTLNELAAALGDDPNFATTVTNALAAKAPINDPTFTGTVSGITKSMVGLGNVDNTSDANKPVSTATQTALDLKANALGADDNYVTDVEKVKLGNLSGTNTGDQTSIVGITGTKAQFNTAASDGDFLFVGDITQYTDELVDDRVANLLVAGTNITLTYDDVANTITIDATGGGGGIDTANSPNANEFARFTDADTIEGLTYAEVRAALDLEIGTDVQAYDADLTTWAGLTPSANAQSLVTAASYAAMRALLDLEAGTDFYSIAAADAAFQPKDADLTTIAGLTATTDNFIVSVASAWASRTPAQVRTTLGIGSAGLVATDLADLNEATIEAAIDTLANLTSIQGRTVTLADAGADAFLGWDDSANAYENLTQAEARTILGLGTAAYVATDLTDLNEATIEAAIDTLPNLTTAVLLPWTGLKPGTDGEIPTFDASGNPSFVPVGTATHVLTSNGAGAAPTFQAVSGGGTKLYLSAAEVTLTNGNAGGGVNTETTLFTTSIAGGILGTNNGVKFKMWIKSAGMPGSASAWTFRIKYGGVTHITMVNSAPNNAIAPGMEGYLEGFIFADGATGAQKITASCWLAQTQDAENAADASVGVNKVYFSSTTATGAVDSTASQTLAVSGQFTNDANNDAVFEWFLVEKIA